MSPWMFLDISLVLVTCLWPSSFAYETLSDIMVREIWHGYEGDVRPLCGEYPAPVPVTMGIAVRQLMELDEPKQILWSSIWLRLNWFDCRLQWNTTRYGGAVRITVPRKRVWTPDLTLYDNAESKLGEMEEYLINVDHTGLVSSLVPVVVRSMCKLNVQMFPFDKQECSLTFGSWTYNGNELNFTAAENATDLSTLVENGEWDILKLTQVSTATELDGAPYPQLVFTIYLRRKPLFYAINLVFPSFMLKCIALVGFILPPDSGEKVAMEITVLLSLSVFQLVVLTIMPPTSENIPAIAIYFLFAMILVAISCIVNVIVLNIHFTHHHTKLPSCIRTAMTSFFGQMFGVKKLILPVHEKMTIVEQEIAEAKANKNVDKRSKSLREALSKISNAVSNVDRPYGTYNQLFMQADSDPPPGLSSRGRNVDSLTGQSGKKSDICQLTETTRKILDYIQKISARKDKKLKHDMLILEWKIFAIMLDRIFLCIYLLLAFILTVTVYCNIAT